MGIFVSRKTSPPGLEIVSERVSYITLLLSATEFAETIILKYISHSIHPAHYRVIMWFFRS